LKKSELENTELTVPGLIKRVKNVSKRKVSVATTMKLLKSGGAEALNAVKNENDEYE
jgi:hypothetical protein